MALRYAVVALVAGAVTTFTLQNTTVSSVRFLVWTFDLPLAGIVLAAVAAGLVITGMPLLFARLRYRSRLRALQARVTEFEARDAEASPQRPSPQR